MFNESEFNDIYITNIGNWRNKQSQFVRGFQFPLFKAPTP